MHSEEHKCPFSNRTDSLSIDFDLSICNSLDNDPHLIARDLIEILTDRALPEFLQGDALRKRRNKILALRLPFASLRIGKAAQTFLQGCLSSKDRSFPW